MLAVSACTFYIYSTMPGDNILTQMVTWNVPPSFLIILGESASGELCMVL